ncbi:MAG: NAD(P)H-hydrate epimerase, partial [Ornithinimicrobium sp.]
MICAYAVADVRAAEAELMVDLPEGELMQRAARGLAGVVRARAQQFEADTVVVLVGPGHNGGDGLFAAVDLAVDHRVQVICVGADVDREGREAVETADIPLISVDRSGGDLSGEAQEALRDADIVLDALVGIGGRAGLSGAMAALVGAISDDSYVVAVDLPSGVDPAGHRIGRSAVFADETVTFGVPKPIHLLPNTEPAVGLLTVVDIGLDVSASPAVERMEHDDTADLWPVPTARDHKYSRGVVGIIAGSESFPGAAVLAST